MYNHKSLIVIFTALLIVAGASAASGQIVYGQPVSGGVGFTYSHWTVKDDSMESTISQLMIPITALIPLQENMELRFFAADASNKSANGDTKNKLSGLSDARLQFNSSLYEDRVLVSLGVNLPIGKKKLTQTEERAVMAALTENYLSFPIRRLGEGFGLNILVGAAGSSGTTRYGASLMYQLNGAYAAYEGESDYKPGNQFALTISADKAGERTLLSGDATYTAFSTDKAEDQKVFKQSNNLDMHVGGKYTGESYFLTADARYLFRGRNTRYDNDIVFEQLKVYGNEFSLDSRFGYSIDAASFIGPLLEVRLIAGNEYEFGSSNTVGFGAMYGRKLGENGQLDVRIKYFTGGADDGRLDLSGYRFTIGLATGF